MIAGVAALRPQLMQSCAQSTVPCHFLDLQTDLHWPDHPEYTSSDGILPTEAGALAIAEGIWAIMRTSCIAQ
jgi:hypothetical protein